MVILRARVMRGRWAVPVSFVPITTLPMGWHWCDDAVNDQHTLTDGGVVNWSVQAVLYHGLLEMRVLFPPLGGPTTATTMGGGSKGIRSTTGKWSFLVCTSSVRLTDQGTQTLDQNVKLCS